MSHVNCLPCCIINNHSCTVLTVRYSLNVLLVCCRQTQNNTECVMDRLKERLNLGHRNKMEQNLLVIEGLEAYNKVRSG